MHVENIPDRVIIQLAGDKDSFPDPSVLGETFFGYQTIQGRIGHIVAALVFTGNQQFGHYS
jgi:hypothetical protein